MDNSSFMDLEPNIVKAKFILSNTRVYTLDFDQNIQMKELKTMIQVAAHLKKNNFRLFSESQEYTKYNEETFESIFPSQNFVVFTIVKGEGEAFDEAELLLQINSSCSEHNEKFLLFYCYDCQCSVCCDCFVFGQHKGHQVQDKCYYLLPSKFLVERLFQSWSRNPYEEYKITTDLSELKNKLNNVLFIQLYQILQEVQAKCNDVIDTYNTVNKDSLGNIRDSVRDIKNSCIKALDGLKEKINIKDIVNDQKIFKEFDIQYKKMGKIYDAKFKQNLEIFMQLNQQVSILINNLIDKIYNMILETLKAAQNDEQYKIIKMQISQKLIPPVDKISIMNQFGGEENRKSFGILDNN